MMQSALVERADRTSVPYPEVVDVEVENGALYVRGPGYTAVFAATAWTTVFVVPQDSPEAAMVLGPGLRLATPEGPQQAQQFQRPPAAPSAFGRAS